jgi:hypothetical protein
MKLFWLVGCIMFFKCGYGQNVYPVGVFVGDSIEMFANSTNNYSKGIIKNDNINGYYEVTILKKRHGRFLVLSNPINVKFHQQQKGWVNVGVVGIGLTNKILGEVPIYCLPNKRTNPQIIKIITESIIAKILNTKQNWMKISFESNGQIITGWLAPENQCNNLFTMCIGN